MMVRMGSHLRLVRHADNLTAITQGFEQLANNIRRTATNTHIDLIKD
jgi:hypothetical protein